MAQEIRRDLVARASPDERVVIQWYAEVQGIPVARLLRTYGVEALLDRGLDCVTAAGLVVPESVSRAAARLHCDTAA